MYLAIIYQALKYWIFNQVVTPITYFFRHSYILSHKTNIFIMWLLLLFRLLTFYYLYFHQGNKYYYFQCKYSSSSFLTNLLIFIWWIEYMIGPNRKTIETVSKIKIELIFMVELILTSNWGKMLDRWLFSHINISPIEEF